jgi:hypothetical protein
MRLCTPLIEVTLRGKLSNEEMRNRLKTTNIVKGIQSLQLNWKQHVENIGENRFPKKILK